jgi:hypothetical protein
MRKYKTRDKGFGKYEGYIKNEDGSEESIGIFPNHGIALNEVKKVKIANNDMPVEKMEVRARNGSYKSQIDPNAVNDWIEGNKIPKDLPKMMRKILKSPLAVNAMLAILANPNHPHYARVLDVCIQLSISDKAKKTETTSRIVPFVLDTGEEKPSLNKAKEVFLDNPDKKE